MVDGRFSRKEKDPAYLNSGLVDALHLLVSPTFMGRGIRLFDEDATKMGVDLVEAVPSPKVTHLRYSVHPKG